MFCTPKSWRHFKAFTLVEMLVALTIASVLTLIALPAVRNAVKQHSAARSAEVVRQVFVNARAQAVKSNRGFGVALRRNAISGEAADYCRSFSFVAAPPTYRGDVMTATAVKLPAAGPPTPDPPDVLRFGFLQSQCGRLYYDADTYLNAADPAARRRTTLRPGAILFLAGNSVPFRVLDMNIKSIPHPSGTATGVELLVQHSWPNTLGSHLSFIDGDTYPFELNGMPIESFLPGVELPSDSAVDLSISGIGLGGVQFNSQSIRCNTSVDADMPASDSGFERIVVMFGPSGNVERVYTETWSSTTTSYDVLPQLVTGTMYLAIGRSDGILAPETAVTFDTADAWRGTLPNFASTETVWLSLRTTSGSITVSPQTSPQQPASAFYSAYSIPAPPSGVSCADRTQQLNVLSLRAADGRRLAKQGAILQ